MDVTNTLKNKKERIAYREVILNVKIYQILRNATPSIKQNFLENRKVKLLSSFHVE